MKVLVIDDDLEIRTILALFLHRLADDEVLEARDGKEGIAAALRHRPDAILLDVQLPDMDGPAVLSHLQAHRETRDIPVIFVTAAAGRGHDDRYRALGARGVIGKPFNPTTFHEDIRRILDLPS